MTYYLLDDRGQFNIKGLIPTDEATLEYYNSKGWGIFKTVNTFKGRRIKENLVSIDYWYVDIDKEPKHILLKRLLGGPLMPTKIVETKNGYHAYWKCVDATLENYEEIEKRLIRHYKVKDVGVRDVTRVLRVPGYDHHKDTEPFLVSITAQRNIAYHEQDMLRAYKPFRPLRKRVNIKSKNSSMYDFDCEKGLNILSGTKYVNGDTYTFEDRANGTRQIIFNNNPFKTTSNFLGREGNIGSHSGKGPGIFQWLKSYGHTTEEIKRIFKEVLLNEEN